MKRVRARRSGTQFDHVMHSQFPTARVVIDRVVAALRARDIPLPVSFT